MQFRHGFQWWRMDIQVACRILDIQTFKLEPSKKLGFYPIFFEGFGFERLYVKYHTSHLYVHASSLKPMSELHTQPIKKSLWCYLMCLEFFEICIRFWRKTPHKVNICTKEQFFWSNGYIWCYFISSRRKMFQNPITRKKVLGNFSCRGPTLSEVEKSEKWRVFLFFGLGENSLFWRFL